MDARCRIELFGGLRLQRDDRVIMRFRTRKAGALLAYLAFHRHRSHPRDELIEIVWPGPGDDRHKLRKALASLRHQLEPPGVPAGTVLIADRSTVQLNPAAVTTDVADFEAALQAGARARIETERTEHLGEAVQRYRGELLPGYYEGWIVPEQQRLAEAYLEALRHLIRYREQSGHVDRALDYARRAVSADPLREEAQHELIRLLAAVGQRQAALRQYEELERLLQQELGVSPADATRELVREIERRTDGSEHEATKTRRERIRHPEIPLHPLAPQKAAPAHEGHLPLQLTRFFGRKQELDCLREWLLVDERRLVTLTGPGGSGKTGLALELARQLEPAFEGMVWFVPLADLADPLLISEKTAGALHLPRSPHVEPLDQVIECLCRQRSLLLLDNFEHLTPGGVTLLQTLLHRARTLTLLVTSRHRLDLPGEREFLVHPLPTPPPAPPLEGEGWPNAAQPLLDCASVQLFVDRAQAVRPDFQLTRANAAAVAGICVRLEGLPLALELSAAWARVLAPAEILTRLDQRFELLRSRGRPTIERHRSLRAALDSSYRLLSPELQRFFAQLSVFRGGWTLAAAEQVCGTGALDSLWLLRGCALVQLEERKDGTRFRLLETLREFGAEQLGAEEREALAGSHAEYFLALAEAAEPGAQRVEWEAIGRLETERDNMRAVLDRCCMAVDGGCPPAGNSTETTLTNEPSVSKPAIDRIRPATAVEIGLRLATALRPFWKARGDLPEGRAYLTRLLAATDGATARTRARALDAAARLAYLQSDYAPARALLDEALAIYREQGPTRELAATLTTSGWLARDKGKLAEARARFDEALASYREQGHAADVAAALSALGALCMDQGEYKAARALHRERLDLHRQSGDQAGVADSVGALARVAHDHGEYGTARSLLEEALPTARAAGDVANAAYLLCQMGQALKGLGHYPEARLQFDESRRIYLEQGDPSAAGAPLIELARLAADEGDLIGAREMLAGHLATCRQSGRKRAVAMALLHLGSVAQEEGNLAEAQSLFEEALTLHRQMDNPVCVATSLLYLGELARARGELADAQTRLEESVTLLRQMGHRPCETILLRRLALVAQEQSDLARARSLWQESLVLAQRLDNRPGIAECLEGLARSEDGSEPERAAGLFRAATAQCEVYKAHGGAQTLPYGPLSLPPLGHA